MNKENLTYKQITPYVEKGLISERIHPDDDNIRIFNYTPECQFSRAWDDITMQCRGLIMNIETGEVLARPFRKFFNYEEHIAEGKSIPTDRPIITAKYDGSLGIAYTLDNKMWIATRGSFVSEQAIWATTWWRENHGDKPYGNSITYLFEILYPQNRIVIHYDFSGLVHLASIDTKTGKQVDSQLPVKKAEQFDYSDISSLSQLNTKNSEGFVIFYPETNLRLKIKFPDYIRLHKIVTGLSEIAIWEAMQEGNIDKLTLDFPDEFYTWFSSVRSRIQKDYDDIFNTAHIEYCRIINDLECAIMRNDDIIERTNPIFRKLFALEAIKYEHPGLLFSMLDDKSYVDAIWKMIRPHGSKTFKVDTDQ